MSRRFAAILAALYVAGLFTSHTQDNADEPVKRTMRIQVLDFDGKPIEDAAIHAAVWAKEPIKANRDFTTDATGRTTVELPQKIEILRLWATKDGYVGLFAQWWPAMQPDGHLIPEEYTFHLARGTKIGGLVKNDAGEPIPGAKVEVRLHHPPGAELRERPYPNSWLAEGSAARTTDAEGRWSLNNVPAGGDVEVSLMHRHPDYISESLWGSLQKEQNVTMEALRATSATVVMHWGIPISGTVRDAAGKPVADAVVAWGDDPYLEWGSQEVRTDAEGRYRLPPRTAAPLNITVVAAGWAPDQKKLDLSPANSVADFDLQPGKTVRIKFVNAAGEPIPKVAVGIVGWRGNKGLYNYRHPNVLDTRIPTQTGADGIYEWKWAPADEVQYSFAAEGYAYIHQHAVTAADEPTVVILRR